MKPIITILTVATIVALLVTILFTKNNGVDGQDKKFLIKKVAKTHAPLKKESRFLAEYKPEYKNPRASDHCRKDNEICYLQGGSATSGYNYNYNSTCCNNKCVDLITDDHNCGLCKNKCEYTEACCRGKCVNLSYDKRHCGICSNRCDKGLFCIYGMCDYP